jgi:hypothetical protein
MVGGFNSEATSMNRFGYAILLLFLLAGCGKEDGGVSGSDPKEILDGVQQQLDAAGAVAEERLEDAMDKIEADL